MVCWRVLLLCELRPPALQGFRGPTALDLYDKGQRQGLKVWLCTGAPLLHSCASSVWRWIPIDAGQGISLQLSAQKNPNSECLGSRRAADTFPAKGSSVKQSAGSWLAATPYSLRLGATVWAQGRKALPKV